MSKQCRVISKMLPPLTQFHGAFRAPVDSVKSGAIAALLTTFM